MITKELYFLNFYKTKKVRFGGLSQADILSNLLF